MKVKHAGERQGHGGYRQPKHLWQRTESWLITDGNPLYAAREDEG